MYPASRIYPYINIYFIGICAGKSVIQGYLMGILFVVIGKSASGKDRIYSELIRDESLGLRPFVICTTRPMRTGEKNGREYFFTDEEKMRELEAAGKIVESRVYPTVHGNWYYYTADDGQMDAEKDLLGICTLESYNALKRHYGTDRICPLYITCEDYTRLTRAIEREKQQQEPSYAEVCRRYLADEEDFSPEKIREAGIDRSFSNDGEIDKCIAELKNYIKEKSLHNI